MLIDCFQKYLNIPADKLEVIKDIIASLHNASLLIDDIEDSSRLRRGVPVAHAVYGVPFTINCANYVYFIALEKCLLLNNTKAMHIFTSELLSLHRGQGHDILWRDRDVCPTGERNSIYL
jgi:geranylgeranyl diphosphate synthase, type III